MQVEIPGAGECPLFTLDLVISLKASSRKVILAVEIPATFQEVINKCFSVIFAKTIMHTGYRCVKTKVNTLGSTKCSFRTI